MTAYWFSLSTGEVCTDDELHYNRGRYILKTPEDDTWEYDNKEDARRDQFIFGGEIWERHINE